MAFKSDNHTQQPNEAYDIWLGQLPNAHYCVLAYIIRHTKGWHRDAAQITYKQMIHGAFTADGARIDYGCGVKSSKTIAEALAHLQELDLIERVPGTSARGGVGAASYRLKVETEPAIQELPAAASAGSLPSKEPEIGTLASKATPPIGALPSEAPALYPVKSHALPSEAPSLSKESIKETTVKQRGVTPVDISTAVDNSARRAREAPPSVSKSELDPLAPWVQKAIGAIQIKRGEKDISGRVRGLWARAVEKTLGHLSQDERDAYVFYLLSDDYIPSRSSPKAVADAVVEDYPTWERMGRPRTKDEQGKRAPKVPAHVQWEHDHAHNPKNGMIDAHSDPKAIEEIVAYLRRTQGEEKAQQWLRKIGLGA